MPYTPEGHTFIPPAILPDGRGGYEPCPELMTEGEVIRFLRIPEISKSENRENVISNLKRMRDLPCIHISNQSLYPLAAIRRWVNDQVTRR